MAFNADAVRDILVCPGCRSKLVFLADAIVCESSDCRLQFQICDDIPIMLVEEAVQLDSEQWSQFIDQSTGPDSSSIT